MKKDTCGWRAENGGEMEEWKHGIQGRLRVCTDSVLCWMGSDVSYGFSIACLV